LILEVDQVLTPVELSRRLGVHIQTVQNWRDNGRGGPRYFKLGRYVFYRLEDVEEFERARAVLGRA
jgi:hypothetical protein